MPVTAAEKSSALSGKSALFVGDSIMTGWRDSIDSKDFANGRGWGYRMRQNYGMSVDIAARAGEAMSTVRDSYMDPIYKQLEKNKYINYDYVILEGGFNDIMGNEKSTAKETAPLGSMSSSYDIKSFDRSTFASGLEHLLCYATTNFPNAKIGFIITFETPYSKRGNGTADRNTTKKYFDLAKQICDKWNVPYLDFYDGATADGTKYFDIFYPEGRTLVSRYPNGISGSDVLRYIKDDIHPNKAGYDATYEYVAAWMQTLPKYKAPHGNTTTTTTTTTTKKPTTTTTTAADKPADATTTVKAETPISTGAVQSDDKGSATTSTTAQKIDYDDYTSVYDQDDVVVMVKPESQLVNATFDVAQIASGDRYNTASELLRTVGEKIAVYSVNATVGGESVSADKEFILKLPMPKDYDVKKTAVARIIDDKSYEPISAVVDEETGTINIRTKRFGTFAVYESTQQSQSSGNSTLLYVLIGVGCVLVLAIISIVVILLIKKFKSV